jgi:ribosomal silencing factor RsfS
MRPGLDAPAQHAECDAAGDVNSIKVGENSNIQDNVVVHVAKHNAQDRALPTIIGNNVTIGALTPYAGLAPSASAHLHVCVLQAWR